MLSQVRNLVPEIKVSLFLIASSGLLLLIFGKNLGALVRDNSATIIKILYLTVIAVGISTVIHFLMPVDFVQRRLKQNKFVHLFYATVFGILTPGPVYAIYPIILVLKKKGVQNPILVSYLTGQTLVGPARIPFEVGLFGLEFFIYRVILSLILGPLAGILYILMSGLFPDRDLDGRYK